MFFAGVNLSCLRSDGCDDAGVPAVNSDVAAINSDSESESDDDNEDDDDYDDDDDDEDDDECEDDDDNDCNVIVTVV